MAERNAEVVHTHIFAANPPFLMEFAEEIGRRPPFICVLLMAYYFYVGSDDS